MNPKLATALDNCIQKLHGGESLEDCLGAYPEIAPELRPLLQLVEGIRAVPGPRASSQSVEAGRHKMLAALQAHQASRPTIWQAFQRFIRRLPATIAVALLGTGQPRLKLALRTVLVVVALLLALLPVTLAVSASSLPGDALYPVKRSTEQVRLFFTRDEQALKQLRQQYAEERYREVRAVIELRRQVIVEIEGSLESLQADRWVVAGFVIEIRSDTVVQGSPQIGGWVQVRAQVQADGTLTALHVQVLAFSEPILPPTTTPVPAPTAHSPPSPSPAPPTAGPPVTEPLIPTAASSPAASLTPSPGSQPPSPRPTRLPTNTPEALPPTATPAGSPTPTPTRLPTSTPPTSSPTATSTTTSTPLPASSTPTPTSSPTSTPPTSSPTATRMPTSTPLPASPTPTSPPTSTPLTSSPTATPTAVPTFTPLPPSPTPMATALPPTPTPTPTDDGQPIIPLYGIVREINAVRLVLEGDGGLVYEIAITPETIIIGDPNVDDQVYVEAIEEPTGGLVALYIEVLNMPPPDIIPISGVVVEINDAEIVVDNRAGMMFAIAIVPDTIIVGDPVVGDSVYVEAVEEPSGGLVAFYIEVIAAPPSNTPGTD